MSPGFAGCRVCKPIGASARASLAQPLPPTGIPNSAHSEGAPHQQTNPNGTQTDNYGTRGNVNPYTPAPSARTLRSIDGSLPTWLAILLSAIIVSVTIALTSHWSSHPVSGRVVALRLNRWTGEGAWCGFTTLTTVPAISTVVRATIGRG